MVEITTSFCMQMKQNRTWGWRLKNYIQKMCVGRCISCERYVRQNEVYSLKQCHHSMLMRHLYHRIGAALSFKCSKEVEWSSASQVLSTCHRIDWTLLVFLLVSLQNRHSIPFNLWWMTTGSGLFTHSLVWTQVTTLIISNLPLYLTQGAAATGRIGIANDHMQLFFWVQEG